MLTLVVATTADPASAGPASALLAMPGWHPGPSLEGADGGSISSYANGGVRLLQHGISIVSEDDLDRRWEAATGEDVGEVIFLSKHTAVTNRPTLTVHPIGVPHLREGEVPPQGGRPGWAGLPNPRIAPWFRRLKKIAQAHGLIPEFEEAQKSIGGGKMLLKSLLYCCGKDLDLMEVMVLDNGTGKMVYGWATCSQDIHCLWRIQTTKKPTVLLMVLVEHGSKQLRLRLRLLKQLSLEEKLLHIWITSLSRAGRRMRLRVSWPKKT